MALLSGAWAPNVMIGEHPTRPQQFAAPSRAAPARRPGYAHDSSWLDSGGQADDDCTKAIAPPHVHVDVTGRQARVRAAASASPRGSKGQDGNRRQTP